MTKQQLENLNNNQLFLIAKKAQDIINALGSPEEREQETLRVLERRIYETETELDCHIAYIDWLQFLTKIAESMMHNWINQHLFDDEAIQTKIFINTRRLFNENN